MRACAQDEGVATASSEGTDDDGDARVPVFRLHAPYRPRTQTPALQGTQVGFPPSGSPCCVLRVRSPWVF